MDLLPHHCVQEWVNEARWSCARTLTFNIKLEMWYEEHKSVLLLATEKQFSPEQITIKDFLHLLEKEMLAASKDMIQNKQTVNRYGSSGPWVNGPQCQQMTPTHCTAKCASWSENQMPLPVSPNSGIIEISWPSEKPLLLFPSPIYSKQPGLLAQEGNRPPAPHHSCWGPLVCLPPPWPGWPYQPLGEGKAQLCIIFDVIWEQAQLAGTSNEGEY